MRYMRVAIGGLVTAALWTPAPPVMADPSKHDQITQIARP